MLWIAAFNKTAAGIVALLLTAMHMTLLGALLALSPRELYAHGYGLDDQHLGGAIMLIVGGVSYIAGGLYLSGRLISASRETTAAREDRRCSVASAACAYPASDSADSESSPPDGRAYSAESRLQ